MKKWSDILYSRWSQRVLDAAVFGSALFAAFLLRLEGLPEGQDLRQLLLWLPALVAARMLVFRACGVYRLVWRFFSMTDAIRMARSLAILTAVLVAVRFLAYGPGMGRALLRLPLGIIAMEGLLSATGSLGLRVSRRLQFAYQRRTASHESNPVRRVLLYGAGRAGQLLVRELEMNCGYEIMGFVDDDSKKVGTVIAGLPVWGNGESLEQLARNWDVDEVIISMATASRQTLARVVAKCRQAAVASKIIPSVREILSGSASIGQLRETRVEDVLGRESVEVPGFIDLVGPVYAGKRILVTGAGGSIGSELVRQLVRLDPAHITLLDKEENSVYELQQELVLRRMENTTEAQIADVRNHGRLRVIWEETRPHIVFHAAAHKHVPLMEKEPCEAILNNVVGTRNVLKVAKEFGTERFVFISTDKAVNPANVMGATKRIGELLVQLAVNGFGPRSACVRFGNVLGSRGSVIPLFQKQIAAGGPVTVTHPDMERYFMTIPEAVQLILCAGTLADHGEIFVLEMGTPRKILELAREMIVLSGLEPEKDIHTKITGLRPGEKLYEELAHLTEKLSRTRFEKLYCIDPQELRNADFLTEVERLVQMAESNDRQEVRAILSRMDLGFSSRPAGAMAAGAD